MSVKVVVPDWIISSAASRVPARTNSGDTVFAFRREDVLLEPLHQREVVSEAAIQHHRRVRVRVDQAGEDDLPAGVERFLRRVA